MPTFNFSSYYLNKNLSDVDIVITVPDHDLSEGGTGRKQAEQLPGHGIVLANVSCLFRAQIEQQGVKSAKITLDVGHDQVPAARALVQYVYTGVLPEYAQHTELEPLIVHMLHLAHTYKVVDCAVACLKALMEMQQLQLETVHLVYSLLPEAADLSGFRSLMEHCGNHLHQLFGNLEATMGNTELLAKLHKLPHAALLALLADSRTEAAAENTVLAAVQSWLAHQPERVELQQRQRLAGAVRIPQLEPMYLATVVPRIPWLVEVLGPQGLLMAAGASKGLFDVHTRPVLSNADVCGKLTAAWMKGVRQQPDSYMLGPNEPGIHIKWVLPLDRLKQAFEAACAAAAASVARLQTDTVAATGVSPAGASGGLWQQGLGATGAAAVSAAAAAAVSFGARMFRKRKRSDMECVQHMQHQQLQVGGVPHLQSAEVIQREGPGSSEVTHRASSHQRPRLVKAGQSAATPLGTASGGVAAAAAAIAGAAAATAAASPSMSVAAGHGAAARTTAGAQFAEGLGVSLQNIKAYSEEVTFAGYTWRLVLYFEAKMKQQQVAAEHSRTAAAVVNAAVLAGNSSKQRAEAVQANAAATAAEVAACKQQQGTSLFSLGRRSTSVAAGSADLAAAPAGWVGQDLGILQTPWGSRRGPRGVANPAQPTAGQQAAAERAVSPGPARQAVAAAAAMRLPDDSSPVPKGHRGVAIEEEREQQVASNSCSWEWHARLAIEAWPCIALQPGVSVAAFSASLAVKTYNPEHHAAAAAAVAGRAGARARQVSASAAAAAAGDGVGKIAAGHNNRTPRHKLGSDGAAAATSGRLVAAGTGAAAARAAARAPRSSSTQLDTETVEAAACHNAVLGMSALQALAHRPVGGHGRRAVAVVAQQRIAQQRAGTVAPESGQRVEDEVDLVREDPSDEEWAAGAAADTHDTGNASGSSNDGLTDYDSDEGEHLEEHILKEKENQVTVSGQRGAACRAKAAVAGAALAAAAAEPESRPAGSSSTTGGWLVRRMPQGQYVKSRKCDQGYSDFFKVTLQQDHWEQDAWVQYIQPGQVLQITGTIWNVR